MFTYVDANTKKLYNGCKVCGNKDYVETNSNDYIYKSNVNIDISEIINPEIINDSTLPKIKNNPNIKCVNTECNSKTITYIKYNPDNMNYLYICDKCGQKWTNKHI
jgi:DNA-directed RNA polymerase subunit M/transcription elongation factor TFIIS